VAGRDEDVRERPVAVDREAAVDRLDARDAARAEARVPPAPSAYLVGVREEVGDRRVVAVRDGREERPRVAAPDRGAHGEPGKRRRREMAVGLRAHPLLANRGRTRAPLGRRVGVRAEDRDLGRLDAAVAQRRVRS
jgi:hypothetical protein